MRVLAITHEGDPLFVRGQNGLDFEIEAFHAGDARLRGADFLETDSRVSGGFRRLRSGVYVVDRLVMPQAPLLVRPTQRFFVAHLLLPMEARDAQERRTRAVERLGGQVAEDEVTMRRHLAHQRAFARKHPKTRPSHPLETERPDPAQARRQEALRRLQDRPVPPDAEMVKHFINGLIRRPVA